VRTKTVKKASRVIIEKYYARLTMDFDTNKRVCEEIAIIQSKRLRNKIAGFTTVRGPQMILLVWGCSCSHVEQRITAPPPSRIGCCCCCCCCCNVMPTGALWTGSLTKARPPIATPQHLMKRIQRGPVRGISLKLQEEERERRMDFVPEESAINTESIEVDRDTLDMLKSINMGSLTGVTLAATGPGRVRSSSNNTACLLFCL
jgi:ribosomal protein S17E